MKITYKLWIALTFFFIHSFFYAQTEYQVHFQGNDILLPSNIEEINWLEFQENSSIGNRYTGWLSFHKTPDQQVQDQLKASGIQLTNYIPHGVYEFNAPVQIDINLFKQYGVKSIIPYSNEMKLSHDLKNETIGDWAINGNDILINVEYFDFITTDQMGSYLKKNQISIIELYTTGNIVSIAVPNDKVQEVASLPFIKYMELIAPPAIKEDGYGRSLHRASNLDSQAITGRNYTGDGIGVLVRDDGIVGPHIDFQGRIDNSLASFTGPDHGDGVAGILAGAGNLDPQGRGMAAGSTIYVSNYDSSFLDFATTNRINNGEVQITNSSYGDGCNGGYTTRSNTVDNQTITTPTLLHVFSAGNSGTSDCGYGAGNGWGNITGGHKQGKNVIATANVYADGDLVNGSSRGPAYDGRIKPDIAAHGQGQVSTDENNQYQSFGGTSGAAPGIAGVAAQLYEVYTDIGNGTLPESALIKAIMLNTANDKGNTGPDFQYGWGIVNGLRAARIIENGHFYNRTIPQGATENRTINIPANTSQVKIMLYWADPAATAGSNTALVNDLDLTVTNTTGTTLFPWVLDSSPNTLSLNTPATTGVDRLNNMEQVVINNPASGNYTISVNGFNIPMGPQKYYVVYDIITSDLELTYPQGGESFEPGAQEYIHWDSVNTTGSYTLEYSTDRGTTWNNITTVTNGSNTYLWTIPNTVSGECRVRVSAGGISSSNTTDFSIANRVTGLTITQVCPTYITVTWNQVAGATSYDIYTIEQEYMEINGSSSSLTYSIPITNPNDIQWIAAVAHGGNGWSSLRSYAIEFDGSGLLNCSLNNDIEVVNILNTDDDFKTICNPGPVTVSATIANSGTQPQSNFMISYQVDNNTIVQEQYTNTLNPGTSTNYTFNTPINSINDGAGILKVWITNTGDEQTINDLKELNFYAISTGETLDITEPFDINGFLPNEWLLDNPDNDTTWEERLNVIGITGSPTTVAFINGAAYNTRGEEDSFTTSFYDLNFNGTAMLTFDLAKAQWSTSYNDALKVEISTDCGATYSQIYFKDALNLATVPYINSNWTPSSANDWRQESIDLTPYIGNHIVLKFVNINDYSNSTFIDNIALTSTLSNDDLQLDSLVTLYPNPANDYTYLSINKNINTDIDLIMVNSLGQQIMSLHKINTDVPIKINTTELSTGLYFVNIKSGQQQTTKKLIIK